MTFPASDYGVAPGAGFFLNPVRLKRGLSDFNDIGVRWIRSTIPWKNIQPYDPTALPIGKPKFNWRAVDGFVATMHLAANAGFQLIITVESPPDWATVPFSSGCPTKAPFNLERYAEATAALAEHLVGTANVFELQNSPNIGKKGAANGGTITAWPVPDPCGYAQLLKLTYPAVKAVRPGATVLVGGIGGTKNIDGERIAADDFLAGLYANGAKGSFDGVSWHPYSTPRLPCDPASPVCVYDPSDLSAKKAPYGRTNGWDRMLNGRNIMVANGDSAKQMWITEFGAPTSGPFLTDAEQVTLLEAGVTRASQHPWVAEFCWYTWQDEGTNVNTDPGGDWMGLVRKDGSHKPAYAAYKALLA